MSKTERATATVESSPYAAKPWLAHYDYWVRPNINYPRRPLHEILRRASVEAPDSIATAFLGAHLTYWEIKQRADKFATALARIGIKQGDRVGIMLPNCPQYVIATFAILRLGAIVVNVNPLYTPREVEIVANDCGIRMLLTLDALMPIISAARTRTPLETIIITSLAEYSVATTPPDVIENTDRFSDLISSVNEPDLPRVEINTDEDVAVLQYTGGTTGVPKGAMLTHYNLFANAIQSTVWGNKDIHGEKGTFLLVIPFFHIYGFTVGMLSSVWQGVKQVLIPKYDVEALLTAIRDYRPTYFPAVPTIYISLLNHPKAKEYGIDKVRAFNCGSAPLPLEVIEQFERITGGTLNKGYGLSEASPVTHSTASLAKRKPGSIGLPFRIRKLKLLTLKRVRAKWQSVKKANFALPVRK